MPLFQDCKSLYSVPLVCKYCKSGGMGKSPFVGIGCPCRAERSWINQTLPPAPPYREGSIYFFGGKCNEKGNYSPPQVRSEE